MRLSLATKLGFALLFERFVGFALGQDVGEVVHGAVPVVQDVLFPVVLDVGVHVLFRMHVDFFPAFLSSSTRNSLKPRASPSAPACSWI